MVLKKADSSVVIPYAGTRGGVSPDISECIKSILYFHIGNACWMPIFCSFIIVTRCR